MRKVKFSSGGEEKQGYYVGVAGMSPHVNTCFLLVEDLEGNIYCLRSQEVKFLGKPINTAPIKVIDLKVMRKTLEYLNKDPNNEFTINHLFELAVDRNIIIKDTPGN